MKDHQVIAFGEDHQARRRSKPTDNVGHRVCMSGESAHLRRHFRHNGPHERFKRSLCRCSLLRRQKIQGHHRGRDAKNDAQGLQAAGAAALPSSSRDRGYTENINNINGLPLSSPKRTARPGAAAAAGVPPSDPPYGSKIEIEKSEMGPVKTAVTPARKEEVGREAVPEVRQEHRPGGAFAFVRSGDEKSRDENSGDGKS